MYIQACRWFFRRGEPGMFQYFSTILYVHFRNSPQTWEVAVPPPPPNKTLHLLGHLAVVTGRVLKEVEYFPHK